MRRYTRRNLSAFTHYNCVTRRVFYVQNAHTKAYFHLCALPLMSGFPTHHCHITKLGVLGHQMYGNAHLGMGFQEVLAYASCQRRLFWLYWLLITIFWLLQKKVLCRDYNQMWQPLFYIKTPVIVDAIQPYKLSKSWHGLVQWWLLLTRFNHDYDAHI